MRRLLALILLAGSALGQTKTSLPSGARGWPNPTLGSIFYVADGTSGELAKLAPGSEAQCAVIAYGLPAWGNCVRSFTIGTTTTGAAGSSASVTNTGTAANPVLAFTIPRGDTGATGSTGSTGATGATGATGPAGPAPSGTGLAKVASGVLQDPASLLVDADVSASAAIGWSKVSKSGAVPGDVGAVPTSRTITAGTGLSGGGDLSADRSLAVSYGTTSGTAAQGNDSRLSDARTPTAHATSHQHGGSDQVATATPGANAIPKAGSGGTLAAGWLPNPSASTLGGVQSKAATTHEFLTSISTSGVPASAQPAAGDITGLATVATSGSAADLGTGTLPDARLSNVVTSGTCGDATHSCGLTYDAHGRITAATNNSISGGGGGTITGSGTASRFTLWSGSSAITSDAGAVFSGTGDTFSAAFSSGTYAASTAPSALSPAPIALDARATLTASGDAAAVVSNAALAADDPSADLSALRVSGSSDVLSHHDGHSLNGLYVTQSAENTGSWDVIRGIYAGVISSGVENNGTYDQVALDAYAYAYPTVSDDLVAVRAQIGSADVPGHGYGIQALTPLISLSTVGAGVRIEDQAPLSYQLWSSGSKPSLFELTDATSKGLLIKGATSQSANLQEWQDSSGTALSAITASGAFSGNSATSTALAANGTNCSGGQAAAGVDASGNAEGCATYLSSLSGAVLTDQSTPQTIGATGARLSKLWATDITVTNAITGSVTGNAGTATALASNPSDCTSGQYANAIAASGNLTCGAVAYSEVSGTPSFATVATSGSASDLGTGTLPAGRLPALTGDVTSSAGSASTTLANIPSGTPMAGSVLATAIAAPATPASGKGSVYVDSTSKALAVKTDAGAVSHTVKSKVAVTSNFLTAIADDGTVSAAQPAASDVTGLATVATSGSASDLGTGTLPIARIADGAVTLAKLADLAQDQFIGRTTASTGVPQTATITAAARTVLDDTTVGAMVDTLGGASASGTGGLARTTDAGLVRPAVSGTPAAAGALGYDSTSGATTQYSGLTASVGSIPRVLAVGVGTETLINSTASDQDYASCYTIPANVIITNKVLRITLVYELITGVSSVTFAPYLKLGSTKVYASAGANLGDSVTRSSAFQFLVFGRAAASASSAVSVAPVYERSAPNFTNNVNQPVSIATNGTLNVVPGITYSGTGSTESSELQAWMIEELN